MSAAGAGVVRHLLSLLDLDRAEHERLMVLAAKVKVRPGDYRDALAGKSVGMMFSKPSTRTRTSFEVGIHQLGGQPLFMEMGSPTGLQTGRGETTEDTAKVLSRYLHALVVRTHGHDYIEDLAKYGSIPVINALTDSFHPCQALADTMTMREHFGDSAGKKLVFVGPGNNVAHSLMLAGSLGGYDVVVACPPELPPDEAVTRAARERAAEAGTTVEIVNDPLQAVQGAHVIYTDAWVSMGQEDSAAKLKANLAAYTVNDALMAAAHDDAVFMHCLPAHRDEEVTASVMDGPRSIIFDQAENRLHAQKALLLLLLGAEPWS